MRLEKIFCCAIELTMFKVDLYVGLQSENYFTYSEHEVLNYILDFAEKSEINVTIVNAKGVYTSLNKTTFLENSLIISSISSNEADYFTLLQLGSLFKQHFNQESVLISKTNLKHFHYI